MLSVSVIVVLAFYIFSPCLAGFVYTSVGLDAPDSRAYSGAALGSCCYTCLILVIKRMSDNRMGFTLSTPCLLLEHQLGQHLTAQGLELWFPLRS